MPMLFLSLAVLLTFRPACQQADDIEVRGGMARDSLVAGERTEIRFTIVPPAGIHVPDFPLPEFRPDSSCPAAIEGDPILDRQSGGGAVVIRQTVIIDKGAAAGRQALRGILVYYYCSDAEGWCRRAKKGMMFPMTVTR